jgi:hypothetical protein
MLVKIEDGFYLNSQHIIAVRIAKNINEEYFRVNIEYTPHNTQARGLYQKTFANKIEAEIYLQNLHQQISK